MQYAHWKDQMKKARSDSVKRQKVTHNLQQAVTHKTITNTNILQFSL